MSSQLVDQDERAQLDALVRGRAFAELRGWRLVTVRGADARKWLHDLVTADVASLEASVARRSLILTPTGRIRADVQVVARHDGFLLLQDGEQPEPVDGILDGYVLSSDVELEDVSGRLRAFAVLGGAPPDGGEAAEDGDAAWTPSPFELGAGLVAATGEPARRLRAGLLADGLTEAFPAALERWRIRRGVPRMGIDLGTDALPAEAGLDAAIDFTKGCFLGQESVAKVRNLGHPPRAIIPVRSERALHVGMPVEADGAIVGEVTSVADDDRTLAIARVRWQMAGARLGTTSGPLSLR